MALQSLRNKLSISELYFGSFLNQQTLRASFQSVLPNACAAESGRTAAHVDQVRSDSSENAASSPFLVASTASSSSFQSGSDRTMETNPTVQSGSEFEREERSTSGARTSSSDCSAFADSCKPVKLHLLSLQALRSSVAPLPVTADARCPKLLSQNKASLSAWHMGHSKQRMWSQMGPSRGYRADGHLPLSIGGFRPNLTEKGTCAYLKSTPLNLLASDLARYFADCGVDESMVHPVYCDNFRPHGWYIDFKSRADFLKAHKKTFEKGLGARAVRMEERPGPTMHKGIRRNDIEKWRGVSVILTHLPPDVDEEALERFFQGYSLAGNGIQIFRSVFEKRDLDPEKEPIVETRAVVKFATRLEAMRAWREKHLEVVKKRSVRIGLVK